MVSKRNYVDVNVKWADGECSPTTKVPLDEWKQIVLGQPISTPATYRYEGQKYSADFAFNHAGRGTLLVGYDEGGVGFDGSISDATITGGEFPEPFWVQWQDDTRMLTFGADISLGWGIEGFSPRPSRLMKNYCFREAIQLEWFKRIVKAELSLLPRPLRQEEPWADPPVLTIDAPEPMDPADCCQIEASDGKLAVSVTLLSATGVRHPGFSTRRGTGDRLVFERVVRKQTAVAGRPFTVDVGLKLTLLPPSGWQGSTSPKGGYFSTCIVNWSALENWPSASMSLAGSKSATDAKPKQR